MLSSILAKFNLKIRKNDFKNREEDLIFKLDPWFYSHYVYAANKVTEVLRRFMSLRDNTKKCLDFGCGDGILTLGVSQKLASEIIGVDITDGFKYLSEKAIEVINLKELPKRISFIQVEENKPLPFDKNYFDIVYSWSVFEHIQDVPSALYEIHRVLKPKGLFFLQIEPLYLSPYGSHLRCLIDEPWAHLMIDEDCYLEQLAHMENYANRENMDLMHQKSDFEGVKRFLITEFKKLNRLKIDILLCYIKDAGFNIIDEFSTQYTDLIPEVLLSKYSEYDLRTNEVRYLLRKL